MLPSIATPSAAPSSRVASFIAEPVPARRAGTADMIEAVDGDIAIAMPAENGTKQHDEVPVRRARPEPRQQQQPGGQRQHPSGHGAVDRSAASSRGVIGETTSRIIAIGRSRAAAENGL